MGTIEHRLGNLRLGVLLAAFLVTAVAAVAQEQQTTPPPETEAETPQAMQCHICGAKILPQTGDCAFDQQGHPLCSECAAKLAKKEREPYNLLTTKRLTGDWGGVRTDLEKVGINYTPMLFAFYEFNLRGGVNTHNAHESAGQAWHNLELDFDKMFGLKGTTFYGRMLQNWNYGINRHVAALGAPYFSGGGAGDSAQDLDKWWFRQRLFDDRLEIRLGKILNIVDLFDHNDYATAWCADFTNRAFTHNMTLPITKGLGAFVQVWPTDWLYFSAAAIDPDAGQSTCSHGWGGFDTAFGGPARFRGFWELGFLPHEVPGWERVLTGHYRFGWWLDPKPKTIYIDDLEGLRAEQIRNDDVGWYFTMDQMVWKENEKPTDKQGLGVFARYGHAHGDVNLITDFWSLGASYRGLIPSRDADVLGFGVAQSILSGRYKRNVNSAADRETVYELYYAFQATPWCVISPNVQVITNPGGHDDGRDAVVAGMRFKIVF